MGHPGERLHPLPPPAPLDLLMLGPRDLLCPPQPPSLFLVLLLSLLPLSRFCLRGLY